MIRITNISIISIHFGASNASKRRKCRFNYILEIKINLKICITIIIIIILYTDL